MTKEIKKSMELGGRTLTLETGTMARQSAGSILLTYGETVILVAVNASSSPREGLDFFPLSVEYRERGYAAGKIPGGFFKREGRPSEKETLTCRLIDRPIRPLFPKGFMNEVQVTCQVVSAPKDVDPDIPALIGVSAALSLSGMPFAGPIGAARVGFTETGYLLNPGYEALADSHLDMVVAGTEAAVLMVESEARELTEDQMLGAVLFAHQEMQVVVRAIKELCDEVGVDQWQWQLPAQNEALNSAVSEQFSGQIADAYKITEKMVRQDRLDVLREEAIGSFVAETGPDRDEVSAV